MHDEAIVRLRAILETAVDAIVTVDRQGLIKSFNTAAEQMFGYSAGEAMGRNVSILMPEPHASRHDQYIARHVDTGQRRVLGKAREITARRKDGSLFPIELALSAADVGGEKLFTGIIRDVSQRKAVEDELLRYQTRLQQMVAERTSALETTNRCLVDAQRELRKVNERLQEMVRVDELTGIGNRRAFDERLEHEARRRRRDGRPLSVIMSDVDHFKLYNDSYGHPAGDACLKRIAGAVEATFQRASEFCARYGGEEFAGIISGGDAALARERAETLRRKIRELRIPQVQLGADRCVTISIGVATAPVEAGDDWADLVQAADQALYRAKQLGRDRVEEAFVRNRLAS